MSLRAILDRLDEAVEDGAALVRQDAPGWKDAVEAGVQAPYVRAEVMGSGGDLSLTMTVSLQPREEWNHGIMQNSQYATFMIHASKGKIEQIASRMPEKFRKRPYRGVADAIKQINAYLKQAAEE